MWGPSMKETFDVSVKGKRKILQAWSVGNVIVVNRGGTFCKKAEIFDEYWLEADKLPGPEEVIEALEKMEDGPDMFTFAQKVPYVEPRYAYQMEWDNVAVVPISTYEHWFQKQISSMAKRNIKTSQKKGVEVRVADYDDEYVKGIMSIFNESPFRHGKKYWHYGKDFETVKRENGTYAERSTYLAAYQQNEMIGYLKIVWDKKVGAIMQILSKMASLSNRPNNALLSEAVKQCCLRGANYLSYERMVYGKKINDSLTKFKESNGFVRMDVPRFYVPLTEKGSFSLKLGLHKNVKDQLPESVLAPLRVLRDKWYEHKISK